MHLTYKKRRKIRKTIRKHKNKSINGWKNVFINGNPFNRGKQYGIACVKEFFQVQQMLNFYIFDTYGFKWTDVIHAINNDFHDIIKYQFKEIFAELQGFVLGIESMGGKTTIDELIAWNFYCSIPYWITHSSLMHHHMSGNSGNSGNNRSGGGNCSHMNCGHTPYYFTGGNKMPHFPIRDHCSAFMATGSTWTKTGNIVCAHNSFCDYIDGQFSNIILHINPYENDDDDELDVESSGSEGRGYKIVMQTSPGWIWSGTDFFVTSAGFIGTETTIGGFFPFEKKVPLFCRIRKAMQYATTLDEYVEYLSDGNSGDYANSWLIGDINTGEIMKLELGLKYVSVNKTKDGVFIGFNAPYDPRIRNLETHNSGFDDIRRHQGARKVRLGELMEKYKGKLDVTNAKKIIADHYDVYLKKDNNPCSRTVCSHYDLDPREYMSQSDRPVPFAPHGAIDGIVCTSELATNMKFIGRFGNSCGMNFNATDYFNRHPQYKRYKPYIFNRPSQKWVEIG